MKKVKKMAFGGGANLPVQAQEAAANPTNTGVDRAMPANSNAGGAMRGQDRAAAMSGRAMPNVPAPVPAVAPVAPAPVADPGLARAAAMSGRTMPAPGVGMRPAGMKKGGSVGSASKRADGIAVKGKTRGKIY